MLTSTCKGDSNLDRLKCPYSMNTSPQISKMRQTHRFVCMTEAVDFFVEKFHLTRQESCHFIWDNQFTMGTDRAIWINEPTN